MNTTRACEYDLGDRVRVIGTGATGTVVDFEISTHPAFADEVTVLLDPPHTVMVQNKDSSVVRFYAPALEPLSEEESC